MTRLLVVFGLVTLLAVAKVAHDRWSAGAVDRSGFSHPRLPAEWRGPGRTWVVFATEYCATCGPVVERLRRDVGSDTVHKILVEHEPELARRFQVRTAPTLLEVDENGHVVHSVAGATAVVQHVDAMVPA